VYYSKRNLLFPVLFTRSSPYRFIANLSNVLATAFGTSSSQATLPLTIEVMENVNNIDPRVTRYILVIEACSISFKCKFYLLAFYFITNTALLLLDLIWNYSTIYYSIFHLLWFVREHKARVKNSDLPYQSEVFTTNSQKVSKFWVHCGLL